MWVMLMLGSALAIAGDSPRHDTCTAASDTWKSTCVDNCPTDQELSTLDACKDDCGKSSTKVYWNCSTCWTDCDKAEQECEAKCPMDSLQDGDAHAACVTECTSTRDTCGAPCADAQP